MSTDFVSHPDGTIDPRAEDCPDTGCSGNRHQTWPKGATIMQTDAHNMDREERRALVERRRSAVAHQLRRLAIELTDVDRQLDDISNQSGDR